MYVAKDGMDKILKICNSLSNTIIPGYFAFLQKLNTFLKWISSYSELSRLSD